jgi:hypothetical protein
MRSLKSPGLILCALVCGLAAGRALAVDCDHNTYEDAEDIAAGRLADCDADGAPDACEVFPLAFAESARLPVGAGPRKVATGDLDGDGRADLVVALGEGALPVIVLRGDGAGGFQPSQSFAGPYGPEALQLADLDGDGRPEVLLTSYDGLSVLPNLGGGDLGAAVLYPPVGTYPPGALAVADLDGDGALDMAGAVWADSLLELRRGLGDGTFEARSSVACCTNPSGLAAGDLNADGHPDLVAICPAGADYEVQVLLGDGAFGFSPAGTYPGGTVPVSPLLADLDGDLDLDLALAHEAMPNYDDPSRLGLYRNDGLGGFGAPELLSTGSTPRALLAVDLDADGDLDLVAGDTVGDSVSVHLNEGAGGFTRSVSFETGVRPVGLAALDLDADGALDLVSLDDPFPDPNGALTLLARVPPREADEDGDGVPDACGAPGALTALPASGGDIGRVTVLLRGGTFAPGTAVELRRSGQAARVAAPVAVAADGLSAQATLDLSGAVRGAWDLAVLSPGSPAQLLAGGFTVEPGVRPKLWGEILGRSNLRVGYDQLYTLVLGNQGNVDGEALMIFLSIPAGAEFIPADPLERPWPPGEEPAGYTGDEVPLTLEAGEGGGATVPIFKPVLPPRRPWQYRFWLRPGQEGAQSLGASVTSFRPEGGSGSQACLEAVADEFLGAAEDQLLDALIPSDCFTGLVGTAADSVDTITGYARGDMDASEAAFNGADLSLGLADTLVSCASLVGVVIPHAKLIALGLKALELTAKAIKLASACDGSLLDMAKALLAVLAQDPNEISGPGGAGPERDLRGDAPFAYTVAFENLATASAPAQAVTVRAPLPADLDPAGLVLGPAGFGEHVLAPEPGAASLEALVDLRPAQALLVEVRGGYDAGGGEVVWTFRSLDPATLAPPEDPLVGFLPPNTAHPAGQGFVTFWASARPGLATGDRVTAAAEIVFDANAPLATNTWSNRVDLAAPVTTLAPLAAESPAAFEIAWTVQDEGAGHADTTVLVSRDGGAEEVWLYRAPGLAASFQGEPGACYSFRARSRDLAWNEEAAPSASAETCVAEAEDGGFWDCACGAGRPEGLLGLAALLAGWALRRR